MNQQPNRHSSPRQQNQPHRRAPQGRRRRRRKTLQRLVLLLVLVVAVLGVTGLITTLIQSRGDDVTTTSGGTLPGNTSQPAGDAASQGGPAHAWMSKDNDHQWNQVGPLVQRTEVMEVISPDYKMIALPENGRIDMSYFNTATVFGDSLAQGFAPSGIHQGGYDILNNTTADLLTYRGVGPKQMFDGSLHTNQHGIEEAPLEALVATAPENVYVMLGANTMHNSPDDNVILEYYSAMLDALRERLGPEVGIYVQSVTPVTEGNTAGFSMDRIRGFNNYLAKLTWEKGMYFLDLHEALADEAGWLRGEFSASDGYHLNKDGYNAWLDYLLTHTVYNARYAGMYLEGSQYYKPQPAQEDPA